MYRIVRKIFLIIFVLALIDKDTDIFYDDVNTRPFSANPSSTLSPRSSLTLEEFKSRFLAGVSKLSHEAVNAYIKKFIEDRGSDSLLSREDRVKLPDNSIQKIMIVSVEGLLRNTGQMSHIGLGSQNWIPTLYIDSRYYYDARPIAEAKEKIAGWLWMKISGNLSYDELRKEIIKRDAIAAGKGPAASHEPIKIPLDQDDIDLGNIYKLYQETGMDEAGQNLAVGFKAGPKSIPAPGYPAAAPATSMKMVHMLADQTRLKIVTDKNSRFKIRGGLAEEFLKYEVTNIGETMTELYKQLELRNRGKRNDAKPIFDYLLELGLYPMPFNGSEKIPADSEGQKQRPDRDPTQWDLALMQRCYKQPVAIPFNDCVNESVSYIGGLKVPDLIFAWVFNEEDKDEKIVPRIWMRFDDIKYSISSDTKTNQINPFYNENEMHLSNSDILSYALRKCLKHLDRFSQGEENIGKSPSEMMRIVLDELAEGRIVQEFDLPDGYFANKRLEPYQIRQFKREMARKAFVHLRFIVGKLLDMGHLDRFSLEQLLSMDVRYCYHKRAPGYEDVLITADFNHMGDIIKFIALNDLMPFERLPKKESIVAYLYYFGSVFLRGMVHYATLPEGTMDVNMLSKDPFREFFAHVVRENKGAGRGILLFDTLKIRLHFTDTGEIREVTLNKNFSLKTMMEKFVGKRYAWAINRYSSFSDGISAALKGLNNRSKMDELILTLELFRAVGQGAIPEPFDFHGIERDVEKIGILLDSSKSREEITRDITALNRYLSLLYLEAKDEIRRYRSGDVNSLKDLAGNLRSVLGKYIREEKAEDIFRMFGFDLIEAMTVSGRDPSLLDTIMNNELLLNKLLDEKGCGLFDINRNFLEFFRRPFLQEDMDHLVGLGILEKVNGHAYRLTKLVMANTMNEMMSNIAAINDATVKISGTVHSVTRERLPQDDIPFAREMVEQKIFSQMSLEVVREAEERKEVLWHIIDRDILSQSQHAALAEMNRLSEKSASAERVWILRKGETVAEAVDHVNGICPGARIDVALSSVDQIQQVPPAIEGRQIKMLVFTGGGSSDFTQLTGVIAALRSLHLNAETRAIRLRRLYSLITGKIYDGKISSLDGDVSAQEFARRIVFELPSITILNIEQINESNRMLKEILAAA